MDVTKLMDVFNLIGYSVILSGLRYYIEVDFLARFLRTKASPHIFILYIPACYIVSFFLVSVRTPLWIQSCVHFAILFLVGVVLLKKAIIIALAPCIITTTLFALMDGLTVSISRALLLVIPRHIIWGTLVPFFLSALLLAVQYFIFKYISIKYQRFNKEYAVSYLYLLLLPCLLTIIMIHYS